MSVNIGSLSYVSTLDNTDFQAKSLQDIKLIQTRLALTGDISGVEKYEDAVAAAVSSEIKLRNELNQILKDAQVATNNLVTTQSQPSGTIFSDSAAEIKAYQDALVGLESGASVIADLNAQLDLLVEKQDALTLSFEAGKISEELYEDSLITINTEQQRLIQNIQQVTDFFSEGIIAQNISTESTQKTTVAIEEEIGVIEELKIALSELKSSQLTASFNELPLINNKIQEVEGSIKSFGNVGKVGFDEFGNAVKESSVVVEDAAVKQNVFQAAIGRATSLSSLGARAVTQFTRQIVGLAVGYISLEIGAKAIESLITYISNLDTFSGVLDQARQNMIAFNAVQEDAAKDAAPQIANLKILYDAATDVNNSLKDRLSAAETLKGAFPDEFKNTNALAIANGNLKQSYDDVTESILKQATVEAAISKIKELEATKLDLQAKQIEIQAKADTDKSQATGSAASSSGSSLTGSGYQDTISKEQQQSGIQQFADFQKNKLQPQINTIQNTINAVIKAAGGAGVLASTLSGANKLIQAPLDQFDAIIANAGDKKDLENIKASLQAKLDALAPGSSQIADVTAKLKQVDDLLQQYNIKADGKTVPGQSESQSLLASQTSVLQKIDSLKDKYASKDKTRDDQELDNIRAQFKTENDLIDAQNLKLTNALKDKKITPAQASKAGLQIIPQISQDTLNSALAGKAGEQSVEDDKLQYEQQKALFTQYNDFKLQAGQDAADKLYGFQLDGFTSYVDFLKSKEPTLDELNSPDAYIKSRASTLVTTLAPLIATANADELNTQQKHLRDLIISDQNYQQQVETLTAKAQDDIKTLTAAGFTTQAAFVKENLLNQITQIQVNGFEQQAQYKTLYTNISALSEDAAQRQIASAEATATALTFAGRLTDDAYQKIIADLEKLKAAINDKAFDNIAAIGSELSSLGQSFTGSGAAIGTYLTSLGSLASGYANVGKELDKLKADQASGGNTTSDYISLISTGLTSIESIISNISSASAQRKQAAEDYYNSVITFQQQYNVALLQQQQLQYQTDNGSIFGTNYATELSDAAIAYKGATTDLTAAEAALSAGQAIVNTKNVVSGANVAKDAASGAVAGAAIGAIAGVGVLSVPAAAVGAEIGGIIGGITGLFGGKKTVNVLQPLLETYPDLIDANGKFNESLAKTLVANNQVDDATKVLLNNTIAYYDEQQAALTQLDSALQTLVGDLGTTLSNNLVTAFENGSDAAQAFGTTVSGVLSNIIQQDLFNAIFGPQLQALQTQLQATALTNDPNMQNEIISEIEGFYKTAGTLVPDFLLGLQTAQTAGASVGLTLFPSTTSGSTGLSGAIQSSVTEATANILAGSLNGIQLNTLTANNILNGMSLSFGQLIGLAQDQLNSVIQIQTNTFKSANNSDLMVAALNAISTNTGASAGDALRAAGFYGY